MEFLFEHDEDSSQSELAFDTEEELYDDSDNGQSYGERFYEVASRESESSFEFERGMGEVLDDMEQEYFFGGLGKKLKRFAKSGISKLGKKAMQMAGGNLKGILKNAAKMGLNSVLPGSGAALSAMGFEVGTDREAWDGFANFSREAFENLAEEVAKNSNGVNIQDLAGLSNVATRAFNQTLGAVKNKIGRSGGGSARKITVRRGETIIIKVV